jgi:hypothetical protein
MSHWLNIGIFVACFGIFVSLADFVLTPKKKKTIETFIDNITLRLDYTKTLDWLQRWLKASRRASIATAFFVIISVAAALAVLIALEWLLWDETPWWMLIGIGIYVTIGWLMQWGWVAKAYEKVGVPIIEALATADSYSSLIGDYLAVIFGGALVLGLCVLLLYGIASVTEHWWSPIKFVIGLGGNFVLGLVLCWLGIILDGIATMIGALIVLVLRSIVDAARWLMWRISSYPKGPLTATLTLIGAILAIIKMLESK